MSIHYSSLASDREGEEVERFDCGCDRVDCYCAEAVETEREPCAYCHAGNHVTFSTGGQQ